MDDCVICGNPREMGIHDENCEGFEHKFSDDGAPIGESCQDEDVVTIRPISDLERALLHAVARDHKNEPNCSECANVRKWERIAAERTR